MNETITLKKRQQQILNIIAQTPKLSRTQISKKLSSTYPVSKATLARDLTTLTKNKLIKSNGKGPKTIYKSASRHPLLTNVSLNQYFATEADNRHQAQTSFNPKVFKHLKSLLLKSEITNLKNKHRSLNQTAKQLDQTQLKRELERFIIDFSWKSSRIEGNTYTLLETETLLKQGIEASGHTKQEAIMILNHKTAFKAILDDKSSFKRLKKSTILALHHILTKDLKITSGIRTRPVRITGTPHKPIDNQHQLSDNLDKIIESINKTDHPLEKALIANTMIAYLQPFLDGNKRTSRTLGNAILMAHDYFPLSFRNIDETEYKQALILFYETNNLYHLKRLLLSQYQFALNEYFI